MFGKDLFKHAREFLGYIRSHKWEHDDVGSIYLPVARASIHGEYTHAKNGEDWRTDSNLIVTEGLNYLLNAAVVNAVADVTAWYLAPYGTAIAPAATWTGANFHTNAGELATSPEGYDEATRVTWTPDAVDTGNTEVTNDATPAAFTMNTAGTIDVNGAGMLSASAKSAGTGTLLSATQFAATRTFNDADVFNLKYKIDVDPV
jgi:hypothetical protein